MARSLYLVLYASFKHNKRRSKAIKCSRAFVRAKPTGLAKGRYRSSRAARHCDGIPRHLWTERPYRLSAEAAGCTEPRQSTAQSAARERPVERSRRPAPERSKRNRASGTRRTPLHATGRGNRLHADNCISHNHREALTTSRIPFAVGPRCRHLILLSKHCGIALAIGIETILLPPLPRCLVRSICDIPIWPALLHNSSQILT
jgi:hypothetical protein